MNREALAAFDVARRAYLIANGWVELGPDEWLEPRDRRRHLHMGHAVNSQLYFDANYREPPPPETPEQRRERWLSSIRRNWPERHGTNIWGNVRQDIRRAIRWLARDLGEAGAVTRVQKARLKRALHASKHRNTGCPCGKEGPPY